MLELGGNAVIGYKQYFDLEGESGIVVRVRQHFGRSVIFWYWIRLHGPATDRGLDPFLLFFSDAKINFLFINLAVRIRDININLDSEVIIRRNQVFLLLLIVKGRIRTKKTDPDL